MKKRVCKYCGKSFTPKHVKQVFCSNAKTKGRRNCKDKYWNEKRDNDYTCSFARLSYIDDEHPFSSEGLGQW